MNFSENISKISWEYEAERGIDYFHGIWISENWNQRLTLAKKPYFYWRKRQSWLLLVDNERSVFYVDKDEIREIFDHFYKKAIQANYISDFEKRIKDFEKETIEFMRGLDKKLLLGYSNRQIEKLFKRYYYLFIQSSSLVGEIRVTNWNGTEKLKELLKDEGVIANKIDSYLNILASSTRNSFFYDMEVDFSKALMSINENPKKRQQIIKRFWKKYCWINCGFAEEAPLEINEVQEKFSKSINKADSLKAELRAKMKKIKEIRFFRYKLIRKFKHNKNVICWSNYLSVASYYKDYLRKIQNKYFLWQSRPLKEEIAKRLEISFKDLNRLSFEEICDGLHGNALPLEKIKQRKEAFVIAIIKNDWKIFEGKKAKNFIDDFNKILKIGVLELKGQVANSGNVKGEAIILTKTPTLDPKKFQGKIIVAPMTTPDLMPFLKHTKAIITDEGGITCHAAIVSRELGIPCIIGTKIATKVLKDGDLVEVDAEKGVARILKNNK